MTKPTSLEQKLDKLSDTIKDLEDAIWSLYDVQTSGDEVFFITDFPVDDSGSH
ncbi:MAG TPA: hypothetical protein VIC51_12720 [Psychromonas sp.]